MSDVFHEDRPQSVIDQVVATMVASQHIGLFITKRPKRMAAYFKSAGARAFVQRRREKLWLGFSAERQQEFDQRWPYMRQLAECGFIVFVSVAPMLAPVTLPRDFLKHGERMWCICSGEEGKNCRHMNPDWARALRDQCAASGVPFFMLQMTGRKPIPADLFVRQFPRRR
jgi:protein gp37